ncbi:MAG TPA: hypothetical protein VG890_13420 [Puia sp.]|nr:hypothetical protein [Puia sp.]
MKKWIYPLLFLLLLVAVLLPYILIPKDLIVSQRVQINIHPNAVFRELMDESNWYHWLSANELDTNASGAAQPDTRFRPGELYYSGRAVIIEKNGGQFTTRISVIPFHRDSTILAWEYQSPTSKNPILRIRQYQQAKSIASTIQQVLDTIRGYLRNPMHVYDMRIWQTMTMDSALVTTKFISANYPTTKQIYSAIGRIKAFIRDHHAHEVNFPMLRIEKVEGGYQAMTAIPIDRHLESRGDMEFKRFVPWKIVIGEVTGGDSTISRGLRVFNNYILDHGIPQMAISFQSLVTDRSMEPDTSRWITRFVTPVP